MGDNSGNRGVFSSFGSNGMKMKNITSDMWEPITATGNYTAYTPPVKENKKAPSQKAQSSAKAKEASKAAPKAPSGKKPKAAQAKSSQKKSAPAYDRPISSGRVPEKKKAPAARKKKKAFFSLKKPRLNKGKNKNARLNSSFVGLINAGKTPDEARRIINRRKVMKRKLATVLNVLFLFFFAGTFLFAYCYFEGAPVENIIVEGDDVYPDNEIIEAAGLSQGVNMLTVRENEVNERVTYALPFVSEIGVSYGLPDTLTLNVISTTERFIIKSGSSYICVDKTGKIVDDKKKKVKAGQFILQGLKPQEFTVGEAYVPSEENKERYEIACAVAEAADSNEIINCGIINVSDLKDITLTYQSRMRLYLGDSSKLQAKMASAEAVMKENNAQTKTGYINVEFSVGAYFMPGSMK